MKLDKKTLTFSLIALYLLGIIVSAYTLFHIEDRLIYDLQVLDLTDADRADAVFYTTYIILGVTLFIGLFAIYYSYKNEEANVIYVEKTKEEKQREEKEQKKATVKESKLDRKELEKYLKSPDLKDNKSLNDLLSKICKNLEASQGAIYIKDTSGDIRKVVLNASYAMAIAESEIISFEYGEGLVGQVAKERKTLYIDEVPEGYIKIVSGLGESSPSYLLVLPVSSGEKLLGVVEIASFVEIKKSDIAILEDYFTEFAETIVGKSDKKASKKPELVSATTGPAEEKPKKSKGKKKTGEK